MAENIFLSYSWDNSSIADSIDSEFAKYNTSIFRDIRDIEYKASIKEFMRTISSRDYVIMIISYEYLTSKNCMFEVLEFIKNENYKDRVIPIITDSANIFSAEGKLTYLHFWNDKYDELEQNLKTLNPTECIPIYKELKQLGAIKSELMEFLDIISDMNNIVIKDKLLDDDYKKLFKYISLSSFQTKKMVLKIKKEKNDNDLNLIELFFNNNKNIVTSYSIFGNKDFDSYSRTYLIDVNTNIKDSEFIDLLTIDCKKYGLFIEQYFDYTQSFYILSMRKTLELKSPNALWWSPFGKGYTENLQDAGIFSKPEVEEALQLNTKFPNYELLGIPKLKYEALINLPIVPYNKDYFLKIEALNSDVIGKFDWGKKTFYHCGDEE